MARRVFFSFHYDKDVSRSNVVRNSWVTQGKESAGFVDKAEFEKVQKQGDSAVKKWIDEQLSGTSVTVVLIGEQTLERAYVKYEIMQSLKRGNGIIALHIHNIKDLSGNISPKGSIYKIIGNDDKGNYIFFSDIIEFEYDYISNNGYQNLGAWIEASAKKHNK